MEKIKQALEKARKEQGRVVDNQDTVDQTAVTKEQPNLSSKKSETDQIHYSETRIFKPNLNLLANNRVLTHKADEGVDSAYRMLRTRILQRLVANDWNSLAVTSPGPDQGKTLTAINLAISLAREVNYTVLLVDFDLKKPSIHKTLGIKPEAGISDFLMHDKPLSEILINPGIERLVILPGRESITNSSEMLKSRKMLQLVDELKNRYPSRLIVFDLPPLLATDDALAFSPYVESTLLVVEEGKTTSEEIKQSMALLKDQSLLGSLLNKSREETVQGYQ